MIPLERPDRPPALDDAGQVLDFERAWPVPGSHKDVMIRRHFGSTPTRYYQVLNRILDTPGAEALAPDLVPRLLRRREARRVARTGVRPIGARAAAQKVPPAQRSLDLFPTAQEAPMDEATEARMGELGKQLGMARADLAASSGWKDRVDAVIRNLARTGEEFTADDVRRRGAVPTDHPRAMGSRFLVAARAGLIRRVGYRPSGRENLHSHPISVWVGTERAQREAA